MSSREVAVLASAPRTATPTPAVVACGYALGVHVVVDVTAIVTAPSITVVLELQDVTSGKWYPLLTSAAITTVSTTVLRVYPGLVAAANLAANDVLTEALRVSVNHGNANSITYSVSAHLVQ
jgi:hypothetical protein